MYTVLIVEDERTLRDALADSFSRNGFSVLKAQDGQEGLAIAAAEKPDLILLDVLMPRMDGITMLKSIRQNLWGEHVPVIILTNVDVTDTYLTEITKYQPAYYFMKSSKTLDDIISAAKETLAKKQ